MNHTPGPWEVYKVPGGEIGIKAVLTEFGVKDPLTFFRLPTHQNIHYKMGEDKKLYGHIAYIDHGERPCLS